MYSALARNSALTALTVLHSTVERNFIHENMKMYDEARMELKRNSREEHTKKKRIERHRFRSRCWQTWLMAHVNKILH